MALATKTNPTPTIEAPKRSDRTLFMGDFPQYQKDTLKFLRDTAKQGPVIGLRFAWVNMIVVSDAEHAKHVLQTNNRNYTKEERLVKILETGGDKVLFTTDGDEWMWRRRLMQPAFHRKQIAQFCDAILEETDKLVAEWGDSRKTVDIAEAMKKLTMDIIGRTMFNVDMADSPELGDAYRDFAAILNKRLNSLFLFPMWVPTSSNKKLKEVSDIVTNALTTIIEARKHMTEPQYDLLDMLLSARLEDSNQSFTQEQLIFEMSSIVFAGHETTATTLSWLLHLLSEHPNVEEKLYAEIDSVLEGRTPAMEDLANLPYLTQVIHETMRMYPSAFAASRRSVEADRLGDYEVPAGSPILINIYGLHHDERYWDDPMTFDPERFSAENKKSIHKYAHMPFLNGPRKCIGEPLSMAEMQLILATLLQKYRFRAAPNWKVEPEIVFVLEPKDGLQMVVEPRT